LSLQCDSTFNPVEARNFIIMILITLKTIVVGILAGCALIVLCLIAFGTIIIDQIDKEE
jgi:hypothetical protein